MDRVRYEIIFSLIFFFFSSFLFLSIMASLFVENFDSLLMIMLKPDGIFIFLTRLFLICGIALSLYKLSNHKSKRYTLFGLLFMGLLGISLFLNPKNDDLQSILEIYSYKESYAFINNIKKLIIDSVVFVFFVLLPMIAFFYQKYCYYLQNLSLLSCISRFSPSFNVSVIFLFGHIIQNYDFTLNYSVLNFALSILSILIFIKMAMMLHVSFYSIINLVIVVVGLILCILTHSVLQDCNLYYINLLFYSIGLLYWSVDTKN